MHDLRDLSNIVKYEDHETLSNEDGTAWVIFLRMELLTPLLSYIESQKAVSPNLALEVIKLGIDICTALAHCSAHQVIHRDISPGNIMVSDAGEYKLGDFGISRTVEQNNWLFTRVGTPPFMAPEIFNAKPYGPGVDIYSLGLVMYWMLNHFRTPFLPEHPLPVTNSDKEAAQLKRFSGAEIPPPKNADGPLADIVMKACVYDPRQRYGSPDEMKGELALLLSLLNKSNASFDTNELAYDWDKVKDEIGKTLDTPPEQPEKEEHAETVNPYEAKEGEAKEPKVSFSSIIAVGVLILALAVFIGMYWLYMSL
jgi:serine/threonine protein kinase